MRKFFPIILFFCSLNNYAIEFYSHYKNEKKEIVVYCGNNQKIFESVKNKFEDYGLIIKETNKLDRNNKNLHIIFDAFYIPFEYFPKNYIVYQTLDLEETPLTKSYFQKLKNAIAVWDSNWKNICKYSLLLDNYLYFKNELIDPLILPCLLPLDYILIYQSLLYYSNAKDTDISSHLPTIFAHSLLQKPKLILEFGVKTAESTRSFKKVSELLNTTLLSIDIDQKAEVAYKKLNIKNGELKIIDDLNFPDWYKNSKYKDSKADIIFIDTSHYYDHTMKELELLLPLLEKNGLLIFHDTNMCPLEKSTYKRINNTSGIGWDNKKGVVRAIKDFFKISFNEDQYTKLNFTAFNENWTLLHYPFCNGLTLIKRIN